MLELLRQIIEFFWEFIPRTTLVGPTERAVSFWLGRHGRVKEPGLYPIWPAFQHWRCVCVVPQLCETAVISCSTEDQREYQLRLAIEYQIDDLLLFETSQYSGQNYLEMLGGSALVKIISNMTSDRLNHHGIDKICRVVKERISDSADQRGIGVLGVKCIMFSRCRSFFVSQAERLVD
jgi:regulator of protease activity HflC (stomatin/prohibitin superfamily)